MIAHLTGNPGGNTVSQAREAQVELPAREAVAGLLLRGRAGLVGSASRGAPSYDESQGILRGLPWLGNVAVELRLLREANARRAIRCRERTPAYALRRPGEGFAYL